MGKTGIGTASVLVQQDHLRTTAVVAGKSIKVDYLVHERWGTLHIVALLSEEGDDLLEQLVYPPAWAYEAAAVDQAQKRKDRGECFDDLALASFSPTMGSGSFRGTGLGWLV